MKQQDAKGGTNYPMPTHKDFCKRCFAYNKGCKKQRQKL